MSSYGLILLQDSNYFGDINIWQTFCISASANKYWKYCICYEMIEVQHPQIWTKSKQGHESWQGYDK